MTTLSKMTTQPPTQDHSTCGRRTRVCATILMLLGSALLIFTRLGYYSLWDDEAITAMTARGVWKTGDTSAWVDDHNLLVYRNGLLTKNFKDRYTPPLQFYLLAPFLGLLGESNLVCRLPFAICGMITVGLLLRWLWRSRPPPLVWWAAAFALLTNAEFFLFQRQCRYYALATTLTLLVAYLYCHLDGRRSSVFWLVVAMTALLAAQYLNYAAAVGCLIVDYAVWNRKHRPFSIPDWLTLIIPQLAVGAIVFFIWNPVARMHGVPDEGSGHGLLPRLHLLWWNFYEMLACDFVIVPLLLLCPLLYLVRKNTALLRAPAALVVYLFFVAALAATTINAEVRYLAPILPLCIGISILAVWAMDPLKPALKAIALSIAVLSMIIAPGPNGAAPVFESTTLLYYREICHPQREPYAAAIAWVNDHVSAGSSIFVQPDWMCYPLMSRASKAIYAWQLTDPPKPEFVGLPDIHFRYRTAPDYMIGFGPWTKEIGEAEAVLQARGIQYKKIDTIPVFWRDRFRPERIWHSFVTEEPKPGEVIYIFQRVDAK